MWTNTWPKTNLLSCDFWFDENVPHFHQCQCTSHFIRNTYFSLNVCNYSYSKAIGIRIWRKCLSMMLTMGWFLVLDLLGWVVQKLLLIWDIYTQKSLRFVRKPKPSCEQQFCGQKTLCIQGKTKDTQKDTGYSYSYNHGEQNSISKHTARCILRQMAYNMYIRIKDTVETGMPNQESWELEERPLPKKVAGVYKHLIKFIEHIII